MVLCLEDKLEEQSSLYALTAISKGKECIDILEKMRDFILLVPLLANNGRKWFGVILPSLLKEK